MSDETLQCARSRRGENAAKRGLYFTYIGLKRLRSESISGTVRREGINRQGASFF
jgi:hypothetical protein